MEIWPTALPNYPDDGGFTETFKASAFVSPMDVGPPKVRPSGTKSRQMVSASYKLTRSQMLSFDLFLSDISGGADAFYWPHPRLAHYVTAKMVNTPNRSHLQYHWYQLSVELEITDATDPAILYGAGWFVKGWFTDWF